MKFLTKPKQIYNRTMALAITTVAGLAFADTSPFVDPGNTKTLKEVIGNTKETVQDGGALIVDVVTIAGFVVIATSLYQLYKSSKDERIEKGPWLFAIFIGGLMAGVGSFMWIIKHSILG